MTEPLRNSKNPVIEAIGRIGTRLRHRPWLRRYPFGPPRAKFHRIEDSQRLNDRDQSPLQRLRAQLLRRWEDFPSEWSEALDLELADGLERASASESEVITVMNPISRPLHLRLAALVSDGDLDTMYKREWAEFAVSDQGRCYLVYRRRDGEDYAIEWSPTTNMPATMMSLLSEPLAQAVLGGDDDAGD